MMKPELVSAYKQIMLALPRADSAEKISEILNSLENINDDTADLRATFDGIESDWSAPSHWISILRVVRFCIVLKTQIIEHYDHFVTAYEKLNTKTSTSKDEAELLAEITKWLHRQDEQFGNYERLVIRLIEEINRGMVDIYGTNFKPDDNYFSDSIADTANEVIQPLLLNLMDICKDFQEQIRIMYSLERMRNLLVP